MMEATLHLPGHKLVACLYEDVENTDEIRNALLAGDLPEFALVNPEMLVSSFHLILAATTAVMHEAQGSQSVKTLHAELIYSLAPSTNISESFRNFGAGKGDSKIVLAFINPAAETLSKVAQMIRGKQVMDVAASLDAPLAQARIDRIRKVFKMTPQENDIEHGVISRMAAKRLL